MLLFFVYSKLPHQLFYLRVKELRSEILVSWIEPESEWLTTTIMIVNFASNFGKSLLLQNELYLNRYFYYDPLALQKYFLISFMHAMPSLEILSFCLLMRNWIINYGRSFAKSFSCLWKQENQLKNIDSKGRWPLKTFLIKKNFVI